MQKQSFFYWLISLLSALLLLFLIAPLIKLLFGSILVSWNPLYNDTEVWSSIIRTLTLSFAATFAFSFGAIPLAYLLAKKNFKLKPLIISIIDIPLVIPHSAAGIALLTVFSNSSLLSKMGLQIVDSWLGICLAMAYVSLPLLIQSAREGFRQIPEHVEKSAFHWGYAG